MSETLSPAMQRELEALRRRGFEVWGPSPAGMDHSMPAKRVDEPSAGMRCTINFGHRSIPGFGATADEAVADAISKLGSVDADPPQIDEMAP